MTSGALLAGVIEQPLSDILPERLRPVEADRIGLLNLDDALATQILDAEQLPRDFEWLIKGGQRAVSEGLAAGGGVWLSAVDPGVPLGPGLLSTCVVFHGPHVRIATARTNATAIMANLRNLIEPPRS